MQRREFLKSSIGLSLIMGIGSINSLNALNNSFNENGALMPILFIGHGSPMNAIEENEFSKNWRAIADKIPVPKAILCISAHWLTKGTYVTAMTNPKTIHDFGGFPKELFDVDYPAPGDPELAKNISKNVNKTTIELDHEWGLDHGAWSVIKQMYPSANIPVLQLSIDYHKNADYHFDLAKELSQLRKKGVLILGSGNMVHNLRMMTLPQGASNMIDAQNIQFGYDWALEMNDKFKTLITDGNFAKLKDYKKMGKAANLSIPTPDHYYPLMYTLGVKNQNEEVYIFNDKCVMGSVSMTSILIS